MNNNTQSTHLQHLSPRFLIVSFAVSALTGFGLSLLFNNCCSTNGSFPIYSQIAHPRQCLDDHAPCIEEAKKADLMGLCQDEIDNKCPPLEDDDDDDDDDEEEDNRHDHDGEVIGQLLFVIVNNIFEENLLSKTTLLNCMKDVAKGIDTSILSQHCHEYNSAGLSCVGIIGDGSRILMHSQVEHGTIIFDLLSFQSASVLTILPILKGLFLLPKDPNTFSQTHLWWTCHRRGPTDEPVSDISIDFSSGLPMKDQIFSTKTKFQRIDVYDYFQSPTEVDRCVFLDGVEQSCRSTVEVYHEALVHPAMFAHDDPKRVAIIGGGECATLREVLKHKTVEYVKMIEIDEEIINLSRTFLPEWNDCSDLKGSAKWCGDDARADIVTQDAVSWFIDHFSKSTESSQPLFDVLIMDALDPQDTLASFSEILYTTDSLWRAMFNSLSEDGIIIVQLGVAPTYFDPPEEMTKHSNRHYVTNLLEQVGFQSIHVYDEGGCGFEYPWTFLVAFKAWENRANWFENQATIEAKIHQRLLRTHSGKPTLSFFDSAVMKSFQIPSRVFETVHNRANIVASHSLEDGSGKNAQVLPISEIEVKLSPQKEMSGRGVFAKVDIKKGTIIAPQENTKIVHFPPSTMYTLYKTFSSAKNKSLLSSVINYMEGYGWQSMIRGADETFVDSGILTFSNHGCKGTFNIGDERDARLKKEGVHEENANLSELSDNFNTTFDAFDPTRERHLYLDISSNDYALTDIKAGEEIKNNYLFFGALEEWNEDLDELKYMCNNTGIGQVVKVEMEKRHKE